VVDGVRVSDRPSKPLRQLGGEMAGLEVALVHALAEHDLCGVGFTRRVCDHDDLGHCLSFEIGFAAETRSCSFSSSKRSVAL